MRKFCKELSLSFLNPRLAKEWDYDKNFPLKPENVFAHSHKRVQWKCKKNHKYEMIIQARFEGDGCPYCSGHRVCEDNCLATVKPKLADEWNFKKNGKLKPEDVTCGSHKVVHWQCKRCGNSWSAAIKTRVRGHGCPYCSKTNKRVCKDNCLATINLNLSKEWHPIKNNGLTPNDVTPHINTKIWWICKNKHSYSCAVSNRSNGDGCPYCSGRRVCKDNCLDTVNPKLAKEWHPTKNRTLTPRDVTSCSGKSVWWKCKQGHEWKTKISDRKNGCSCPDCSKIEMKDGTFCDSLSEAYYYLKLKSRNIKFIHHISIGFGRCICDFYIPRDNRYIEVTGFYKNATGYAKKIWPVYHKNILRKKNYITKILKAKFKFVQLKLTPKQTQFVRENSI